MSAITNIDQIHPLMRYVAPEYDWPVDIDMMRVVFRDDWSGNRPKGLENLTIPVRNVILIFSTNTKGCESQGSCKKLLRRMQATERQKLGMPDIKYNFLIGGDGTVYEGRGWFFHGQSPPKYYPLDDKSVSIALIGNYRKKPLPDPNHVIPREEWKARRPRSTATLKTPVSNVIFTLRSSRFNCQDKKRCKLVLWDVQRRNMKLDMSDIMYNFVVDWKGRVYEGRGWTTLAPAPVKYSPLTGRAFHIGFLGNFSRKIPPQKMYDSAFRIINTAIERKIITRNYDIATFKGNV